MKQLFLLLLTACVVSGTPASAQEPSAAVPPPYDSLNLSQQQAQQIRELESNWSSHYQQVQPRVQTLQKRLQNMLSAPKSGSIEITTTQQRINQLREQLGVDATSTYLRKRNVLNQGQRTQLDNWMRRQFTGRTRGNM